jgi:hypothetical protein
LHRRIDGGLEQFFDAGFADGGAKAANLRGIAGQFRGVVVLTAEVLPYDVFGPPGDQFFVTKVEGVLEVKQSGHEPDRQAWPARCTDPGAGDLQARAKEIAAGDCLAVAVLACKGRCQGGFDLRPRHPVCQHGKRVSQVNHLVEPGSEKIVSCHLRCPPFPSGFSKAYSSFSEIAMGKFAVNSLCLQGFYRFAWPTNYTTPPRFFSVVTSISSSCADRQGLQKSSLPQVEQSRNIYEVPANIARTQSRLEARK